MEDSERRPSDGSFEAPPLGADFDGPTNGDSLFLATTDAGFFDVEPLKYWTFHIQKKKKALWSD